MNVPQQSPASPPAPPQFADPLEQRDSWRSIWSALTSDALLLILCGGIGLMVLLAFVLPQAPASGTADAFAYSQWQVQAQAQTGTFYETWLGAGLFNIFQQAWLRLLMALLAAVSFLRLFDAVARLRLAGMPARILRDEWRVRVTDHAPTITELADQLRARRYRVATSLEPDQTEALHANRTPLAELISIAFHAGLLVLLLGALLNGLLGWRANSRSLVSNTQTVLSGNISARLTESESNFGVVLDPSHTEAALALNQNIMADGITLELKQVTPGFRVSATSATNQQSLTITLSNYSAPATDAQITFLPDEQDSFLFVPRANMVVQLSLPDAVSNGPITSTNFGPIGLQARLVPEGNLVTQTLLAPELSSSIIISGVVLELMPSNGAIIDASYQPGNPLLWAGLVLAILAGIGTLLYPIQRIVVRHHGHWTEFYASGRGVRSVIAALLR